MNPNQTVCNEGCQIIYADERADDNYFFRPDLDPNCLQRLSADNNSVTSRPRDKGKIQYLKNQVITSVIRHIC